MRESRTYGSVRGACDETHVPTATTAPRVHHAARRRGGGWPVAARAQQAETACVASAYSRARGMLRMPGRRRGVSAGIAAAGLDRRPQRADRLSLGRGQCRRLRKYAAELVALAPDVILTAGAATVLGCLQATRTVPIVFATVPDPVGAGFVDSLARPGGNVTGFMQFEYSLSGEMAGTAQADRSGA